jgi:hypothetical protein
MTSKQKIQANRENALRSTGPKTQGGLRRSSMNAFTHGLAAKTIVIPGEDAKEFEKLHAELLSAWRPADAIEADLVGQLAVASWKMRRVSRIEADMFRSVDEAIALRTEKLSDARTTLEMNMVFKSRRYDAFLPFDKLIQYGATYERRYYRALHTLMQLRATRSSEQTFSITPGETKAIEAPNVEAKVAENSE